MLLPETRSVLRAHVGLARLIRPEIKSATCHLSLNAKDSLVEAQEYAAELTARELVLEVADLVPATAPEHGPEVVAEGISLRGLVDAPSVETASTSAFVPAKSSRDGVRTQRHGRS